MHLDIVCTISYFNWWRGFRSDAAPVEFTEWRSKLGAERGYVMISDHRAEAFRASMIAERRRRRASRLVPEL